jgi:bis(5'-adenosyl)-triphosphatase
MTQEELQETTWAVSKIAKAFGPCSIAVQDGREAGQTVPHVHFHILPRQENGIVQVDSVAKDRTAEEMKEESEFLKKSINFD